VNAMLQAAALHIGQALAANGVVHHPYIGIPDANHLAMALMFMALWPTLATVADVQLYPPSGKATSTALE
jgi:hypothetical protein